MDCQRARERFVDALTGNLRGAEVDEVWAHLEGCAACRAETETLQNAWHALATLDAPRPHPSLVRRFERRWPVAYAAQQRRWRAWVTVGGLAAALAVGFALGYGWRSAGSVNGEAAAPPGYLLLLRASVSAPPSDPQAVYDEYAGWAASLSRDGRLVSAEELADEGVWLAAGSREPTANPAPEIAAQPVVGFFWIRAANADSAVARARESPHFRRGGSVEIRAIQRR